MKGPCGIGMTGYCFGGGVTLNAAAREPSLRAAVPYCGTPSFPGERRLPAGTRRAG
jgi:dienelactone hydrolase